MYRALFGPNFAPIQTEAAMRIILILLLLTTAPVLAQTPADAGGEVTSTDQAVDVEPGLADTRIAERIADP